MKLLVQRTLRSSTQCLDNATIMAEAVLLSSHAERAARLVAAKDTFLIEKAEWEILRSGSCYEAVGGEVPQLIGTEAYFGAAPALARAFPTPGQDGLRELFAECIKAVLQSETYLYLHRGFVDADAYQTNWDQTHPNSCRFYSHLDLVKQRWFDHIGTTIREKKLFHRHKSVAVWADEQMGLRATGSFLDSFHEVGIEVNCDVSGTMLSFSAGFLRAPDQICFGTSDQVNALVGKNIRQLSRTDINRCVGGSEGCAHLLDITRETLEQMKESVSSFDADCQ